MTRYRITERDLNSSWDPSSFPSRSEKYPSRETDVRKKIFEMTQAKHNISFVYKESLRSMIASFGDIGYINSEGQFIYIKCIHGSPERVIAKINQEDNIILPVMSISQTVSDNDDQRRRYESVLVHEKYWDTVKNRAIRILSLSPRPVNIKYQLNIWAKYLADMDQILEQVRLKFNPEMNVPTQFSTLAKAYMDTEESIGGYSAADKEDRNIQKTVNIVLRTYIPSPKFLVTSTGEIEEFKSDFIL
jgi:hypothetical protein